jgi:hypothetical protein
MLIMFCRQDSQRPSHLVCSSCSASFLFWPTWHNHGQTKASKACVIRTKDCLESSK